jgi:hypothetical protein
MKIPEPKYEFWTDYYILYENRVAITKFTSVTVYVEESGHSPKKTKILYDGFIDGKSAKGIDEYLVFATKMDLLKSL